MTLQPGEVTTYGEVADLAGYPKQARLVGRILSTGAAESDDDDIELPWWRVVNAAGRLVPGNEAMQTELLLTEDVLIRDNRVRNAPLGRFSQP